MRVNNLPAGPVGVTPGAPGTGAVVPGGSPIPGAVVGCAVVIGILGLAIKYHQCKNLIASVQN